MPAGDAAYVVGLRRSARLRSSARSRSGRSRTNCCSCCPRRWRSARGLPWALTPAVDDRRCLSVLRGHARRSMARWLAKITSRRKSRRSPIPRSSKTAGFGAIRTDFIQSAEIWRSRSRYDTGSGVAAGWWAWWDGGDRRRLCFVADHREDGRCRAAPGKGEGRLSGLRARAGEGDAGAA